jgi:hypothetical protein
MLAERALGLGQHVDDGSLVLVRGDMRGKSKGMLSAAKQALHAKGLKREGGLPRWFMEKLGNVKAVGPDDVLKRVGGIRGLLLEGMADRTEEHVTTVKMPSLNHAAKFAIMGGSHATSSDTSAAISACGGTFRFVELKFQSLAQAKHRALLVYLCTFNSHHHMVVPLLSLQSLHDTYPCIKALNLWDLYGLTWPAATGPLPTL